MVVNSPSASSIELRSSGENMDEAFIQADGINQRVHLQFVEDFGNPNNRKAMQLYFTPQSVLVSGELSQVLSLENMSIDTSDFILGGLQFGISQVPSRIESASISAVPIPSAIFLLGSDLIGILSLSKRKSIAI